MNYVFGLKSDLKVIITTDGDISKDKELFNKAKKIIIEEIEAQNTFDSSKWHLYKSKGSKGIKL